MFFDRHTSIPFLSIEVDIASNALLVFVVAFNQSKNLRILKRFRGVPCVDNISIKAGAGVSAIEFVLHQFCITRKLQRAAVLYNLN